MKDTLEYRILKHLKENDNGDFIDMIGFISDRKLLESNLKSLSAEPEKYISARFPFFVVGGGLPNFTDDQLKAKIEFKGVKFLDEIEKENKNITNNGILIQDSLLDKSPIKQKTNPAPKNNPERKSLFKRIYSDPWVIGVLLVIIAALLNTKRIKNWIDKIIENILN